MDVQQWLTVLAAVVAVAYLARRAVAVLRGKGGSCGGCHGCSSASAEGPGPEPVRRQLYSLSSKPPTR
jgi:hypothetical protein